ncbi:MULTISPECIES: hypothetical protein [Streptomyces]|uniref:hypothetical protein n=1 Tax=Streptomyces TaxID=1883 RepID=UPI0021A7B12C|nr:hypothetical protein [Streptomyces atratus]MCT2543405.1 hypothetical protein [Streptomyces atratus]
MRADRLIKRTGTAAQPVPTTICGMGFSWSRVLFQNAADHVAEVAAEFGNLDLGETGFL